MRRKQPRLPTFGGMFGQRLHDGRHTATACCKTGVQHLAHGASTTLAIKKWSANPIPTALS